MADWLMLLRLQVKGKISRTIFYGLYFPESGKIPPSRKRIFVKSNDDFNSQSAFGSSA
jgi:hypothetical protein